MNQNRVIGYFLLICSEKNVISGGNTGIISLYNNRAINHLQIALWRLKILEAERKKKNPVQL